jgi:hypothetical protein
MSALAELGKVTVESLKSQPLALAIVVVNLLFLVGFAFMLHEIAQAVERKDALLADMVSHCGQHGPARLPP